MAEQVAETLNVSSVVESSDALPQVVESLETVPQVSESSETVAPTSESAEVVQQEVVAQVSELPCVTEVVAEVSELPCVAEVVAEVTAQVSELSLEPAQCEEHFDEVH